MSRCAAILFLVMAGCTNAPLAEFLDTVAPARVRPEYRDGVEPIAPIAQPPGNSQIPLPASPPSLPPISPADRSTPFSPGPLTIPNT